MSAKRSRDDCLHCAIVREINRRGTICTVRALDDLAQVVAEIEAAVPLKLRADARRCFDNALQLRRADQAPGPAAVN